MNPQKYNFLVNYYNKSKFNNLKTEFFFFDLNYEVK